MRAWSPTEARVVAGVPESNADLLYLSGYSCPDPAAYFRVAGRSYLLVNDLELQGARRQAHVDMVLPYSRYHERLRARGTTTPDLFQALAEALRERRVRTAAVPASFPAGAAARIAQAGIRVRPLPEPFLSSRARKTPAEVRNIRKALRAAEAGLAAAVIALAESRIGRNSLLYLRGKLLTTALLRETAERAIFAAGAVPAHSIVAGGVQGADPHAKGSGPLPANRPIVLDLFPRSRVSGYYGDITRTVVKGQSDERTRSAYRAVLAAQALGVGMIRSGADGMAIHSRIREFFAASGFPLRKKGLLREGFIHGTGHGLGLELHEPPSLGNWSCRLEEGHVITMEPGLYYRSMGGIRIEDVFLVTKSGSRKLTRFPHFLEIP
jgi:Xaa-Pro aminopeptidase